MIKYVSDRLRELVIVIFSVRNFLSAVYYFLSVQAEM